MRLVSSRNLSTSRRPFGVSAGTIRATGLPRPNAAFADDAAPQHLARVFLIHRIARELRLHRPEDRGSPFSSSEVVRSGRGIVVEDIVDTGLTLTYLLGQLATRAPRTLSA